MARHFDVTIVTDARLPGGTSASTAEEIHAQAHAGYTTALVHVDSPLVRRAGGFAPRLAATIEAGSATLVLGDEPVHTDLLLLRHPTVAASIDPALLPPIVADTTLIIANQAPTTAGTADATGPGVHYDPRDVDRRVRRWLGTGVRWAPIGPLVRDQLTTLAPELELAADDWVNVIDLARWRRRRSGPRHDLPVIGRHSRDDPSKWPATRSAVLEVYPAATDVGVHILGGERFIHQMFDGRPPANWTVHPFGSLAPDRFLAGIDFYVYYHHPAWVEAFGRSVLEALATGLPTILPPTFASLFGTACRYAPPGGALGVVRALHADPADYRAASAAAVAFVEDNFSHTTHLDRIRGLVRRTPAGATVTPRPRPAAGRRVLFVSSNGAGVGHLARLMAFARHAPSTIEPVFLTFSQAAGVVDAAGHVVEYLASRRLSGAASAPWHRYLRERVGELIARYEVQAIVFDGTWPYRGLLEAAEDVDVPLVWSRRAMWRRGVSNPVIEHERDRFALVLEPGEFAADEDRGITRRYRKEARRLPPVSWIDPTDALDRASARAALGLDPDRVVALVTLGAGTINDLTSVRSLVVDRLLAEPDLQVCVTDPVISDGAASGPARVQVLSAYPLARYLAAFDLAVAAAGYNTFHELVAAGIPTALVPNTATSTDDQEARARFADRVGVGIDLGGEPSAATVDEAIGRLLDPDLRRRMAERARARGFDNGAAAGMQAITDLLDAAPDRPAPLATTSGRTTPAPAAVDSRASTPPGRSRPGLRRLRRVGAPVLQRLPAPLRRRVRRAARALLSADVAPASRDVGMPVPPGHALAALEVTLPGVAIVLPAVAPEVLAALVHRTAALQRSSAAFAPLFLTSDLDLRPFRHHGYLAEYFPPRERFERLATPQRWEDARRARFRRIVEAFAVSHVVVLPDVDDGAALDDALTLGLSPLGHARR